MPCSSWVYVDLAQMERLQPVSLVLLVVLCSGMVYCRVTWTACGQIEECRSDRCVHFVRTCSCELENYFFAMNHSRLKSCGADAVVRTWSMLHALYAASRYLARVRVRILGHVAWWGWLGNHAFMCAVWWCCPEKGPHRCAVVPPGCVFWLEKNSGMYFMPANLKVTWIDPSLILFSVFTSLVMSIHLNLRRAWMTWNCSMYRPVPYSMWCLRSVLHYGDTVCGWKSLWFM